MGSVEWMQLASQRPWKVELKSMTVDPTSEVTSFHSEVPLAASATGAEISRSH